MATYTLEVFDEEIGMARFYANGQKIERCRSVAICAGVGGVDVEYESIKTDENGRVVQTEDKADIAIETVKKHYGKQEEAGTGGG